MRTPAAFTAAPGPAEPDHGRELGPVDGVKEAVLAPDGHHDLRLAADRPCLTASLSGARPEIFLGYSAEILRISAGTPADAIPISSGYLAPASRLWPARSTCCRQLDGAGLAGALQPVEQVAGWELERVLGRLQLASPVEVSAGTEPPLLMNASTASTGV